MWQVIIMLFGEPVVSTRLSEFDAWQLLSLCRQITGVSSACMLPCT